MRADERDAKLLSDVADLIHQVYQYINVMHQQVHKADNINSKIKELKETVKILKKEV